MALSKADEGFTTRVIGAATQGAAGALVGACLSSVTEPIVNRVLVKRMTLSEAVKEVDFEQVSKFFNTTVSTNFIKFPFFEVVNMVIADRLASLESGTAKGAILGAVFTTATLPITNYRYCKSVGIPVDFNGLYKAYLPTVGRDIVYGICRNNIQSALLHAYPHLNNSASGRFILMFVTVFFSCIISAPGNEIRGYFLSDKSLPINEFFKPERFIRSTAVGATIMSTALGVGTLATGPATELWNQLRAFLDKNPVAKTLVILFIIDQYLQNKRHNQILKK